MANPETTNTIKQDLKALGQRLEIIEECKYDILYLLDNLDENQLVLKKIYNNQIITWKERENTTKFLDICHIRTLPSDLLNTIETGLGSNHKETIGEMYNFVQNYPFVVDADEVREDISSQLGDGIAEIWQNGEWGLVKKIELPNGEKGISTLFDYNNSQGGALTFSQDEYDKYGLIEVINHKVISQDSYNIMFLQREKEPLDRFIRVGTGNYHMLQDFDRDGIGFTFGGGPYYYLIYKDTSPQGIKIYKISAYLKSNGDAIKKGFDSFNTFEVEIHKFGKVTFKKSFDELGKLRGICAFKKKRFGGEEQVRARDKK